VEVPYFLNRYDPDPLRFYLTATTPEPHDTVACPERQDAKWLLEVLTGQMRSSYGWLLFRLTLIKNCCILNTAVIVQEILSCMFLNCAL
jgi:hypothetical protein